LKSLGHPILNDTLYGGKFVGNGLLRFKFPQLFEENSLEKKDIAGSDEHLSGKELENASILK